MIDGYVLFRMSGEAMISLIGCRHDVITCNENKPNSKKVPTSDVFAHVRWVLSFAVGFRIEQTRGTGVT